MLNLNELLAKQDQLKRSTAPDENRAHVRQRVEDVKVPMFHAVATTLMDIWKTFSNSSLKSTLEIEIRIGSVILQRFRLKPQITEKFALIISDQDRQRYGNNISFESGIDEILASFLQKHVLVTAQYRMTEEPIQRLRFDGGSNRYEVNENGAITASEKKTKLHSTDISLLGHHYDIRIAIATEENQIIAANDQSIQNLKMVNERIKKRKSYKSIDPSLQDWKIDFTEVESFPLDANTGNRIYTQNTTTTPSSKLREIELEIEMESSNMLEWLNITEEIKAIERTKKIAESLIRLLNTLISSESDSILENFAHISQTAHYFNQINKINQRMTSGTSFATQSSNSNAAPSFLGSKPLNLTRRNLYHIETMPYYITEKSDGLRSLLYVIYDVDNVTPAAVLMSRAKEVKIFKISGSQLLGKALGYGTVLDGELVYNISLKRTVFLVFDVLCLDSTVLIREPFHKRLKCLNEDVATNKFAYLSKLFEQQKVAFRSQSQSQSTQTSVEVPLDIIRKVYFTKAEISKLIERIKTVDNNYVYYDTTRRHHQMDGIIFQPDMPYTFGNQPDLLKWKFSDLRSIDLSALYDVTRDRVQLLCSGPDGALIDVSKRSSNDFTLFGKFDKFRLLADIHDSSLNANKPKIIECMFDVHIGLWKYLKFRKDKDEPNYIDTVVGVFMEQSENITMDELVSTLKSS